MEMMMSKKDEAAEIYAAKVPTMNDGSAVHSRIQLYYGHRVGWLACLDEVMKEAKEKAIRNLVHDTGDLVPLCTDFIKLSDLEQIIEGLRK
jgi:hypothetical protein